jgi:hypothetical protein
LNMFIVIKLVVNIPRRLRIKSTAEMFYYLLELL